MKGCIRNENSSIFDNLEDKCQECLNSDSDSVSLLCPLSGLPHKQKKQLAHGYNCFLCLSQQEARNKNVFLERFQIFISSVSFLSQLSKLTVAKAEEIEREKYYKIVHNLRKLNAEALGSQYNFIPQEKLTENYRDLFSFVFNIIENDLKGATLTLLKQAKINAHIKTEFDTHELLSMENPILEFRNHGVREVILNVYHPFERDFKDKNIFLAFSANIGYARFDYRTMRLAFAHILSNSAKYVKPGTDIDVGYENNEIETVITFSMCSMVIKQDEVQRIFEDGVSGAIPKANKLNGSGLGMGLIKKAVELNNGSFSVVPGKSYTKTKNGISYADNSFIIRLKKQTSLGHFGITAALS